MRKVFLLASALLACEAVPTLRSRLPISSRSRLCMVSTREPVTAEALNGALMAACTNGDPAYVKDLLDRGADPNAADANGVSALSWARSYGRTETAALLERELAMRGVAVPTMTSEVAAAAASPARYRPSS